MTPNDSVSEFTRFYLERREEETKAAGKDERKRKKLQDDFTPRISTELVALKGQVHREVGILVSYMLDSRNEYEDLLVIVPSRRELIDSPTLRTCARTGRTVPASCLRQCEASHVEVLTHLLIRSELSGRYALPEYMVTCEVTGKRILNDEAGRSSVTGRVIMRSVLQESAVSGKRAEPEHISKCAFTGASVLSSELAISELSGKPYRNDEQIRSSLSGKTGHKSEFVQCHETQQVLSLTEAEHCEVTGSIVRPGILQACQVSGKRVLPNQLERCPVTGKLALSKYFVTSNISNARLLESAALKSASGRFCTPQEGRQCFWTGGSYHPEDLCTCSITGLQINLKASTLGKPPQLGILADLLNGDLRPAEESRLWDSAALKISAAANVGKSKISAAALSDSKKHLAVVSELKTLFGMRIHHLGAILNVENGEIVGRIGFGKRTGHLWVGRSQ